MASRLIFNSPIRLLRQRSMSATGKAIFANSPTQHQSFPRSFCAPTARTTTAAAATTTIGAATGAESSTSSSKGTDKIPDVPSTSLGLFEEADAKDPNKWKKFAWKYASAVIVFMVSYKTLHWYVDKMEEQGKQQREQLEEDKTLASEIRQKSSSTSAAVSEQQQSVAMSPLIGGMQEQQVQQFQRQNELDDYFEKIGATTTTSNSSELDELFAYRKELQQQKQIITAKIGNDDEEKEKINMELMDIEAELKGLQQDIDALKSL